MGRSRRFVQYRANPHRPFLCHRAIRGTATGGPSAPLGKSDPTWPLEQPSYSVPFRGVAFYTTTYTSAFVVESLRSCSERVDAEAFYRLVKRVVISKVFRQLVGCMNNSLCLQNQIENNANSVRFQSREKRWARENIRLEKWV